MVSRRAPSDSEWFYKVGVQELATNTKIKHTQWQTDLASKAGTALFHAKVCSALSMMDLIRSQLLCRSL